jgi:hypothetical protein
MRKLAIGMILFLAACSSSGGNGDGGQDAWDAGSDRPDLDTSLEFLLVIPPGTSLCNRFSTGRDMLPEHAMRGMVDLKPGNYVIKREAGLLEVDIVESVRFGTQDNLLPEAGAPGEVEVEFRDDGTDRYWYYQFRKAFTLEGQAYNLEVRVPVRRVTGGWPEEVVMDAEFMTWNVEAKALIGPGVDPEQIQFFDPCDLSAAARTYTMTGASGTVLSLQLRYCKEPPEWCAGCTKCVYLSQADVELGAYQETVTDHFRLTYSAGLHNLNPHHLVVLQQPQNVVAALLVDNALCFTDDLIHLDADLLEIGREAIVDCQYGNP